MNEGHGHVYPREDGVRARCGGPACCQECARDLARKQREERQSVKVERESRPWVGVDLDGTLAEYKHMVVWDGSIGPPVPQMVERVKALRAQGIEVRILTARVASDDARLVAGQRRLVEAWCREHLGEVLAVTAQKDYDMVVLFDDRAVRIVENTGRPCCDHFDHHAAPILS